MAGDPQDREAARKEQASFDHPAHRMDYPAFRKEGWPIGSGRIEGAAKTLIKQRFAAGGMRWSHAGAQALGTLRAVALSGGWEAFWATQPFAKPERRIA